MFRQALLLLGAIVLIAAIHHRPSVCQAADELKAVPPAKAEGKQPNELDFFDIEDPSPANSGMDTMTGNEAPSKPDDKILAKPVERAARAIAAALVWLANHQAADGSWSLHDYAKLCKDKTCTGQSDISSDAGATALGLLPFLAAGQTHKSKGPYKELILKSVKWLIKHQQPDGNLAKGSTQMMYGHGLATIALSEAYGLTGDKESAGGPRAVAFI